ncbi:MAG: hypothetical protein KAW41_01115 [Candidatus Diapherotrites archaeon]|nr:hypothetical protein [Candidatus Diapherotrites archaeon]
MTVKIYKVDSVKVTVIRQAVAADHWARNGYTLRAGRGLGFDIDQYFLYVDAPDEFFEAHEAEVLVDGVSRVEGNEFDNVSKAIKSEEDSVASGIALFG